MITLWCEHAWLGGATADAGVLLEIVGDRIHSVQSGVERAPEGCLVRYGLTLPGFANAHSHAFHRVLRGRTHSGPGSFWTWRNTMYAFAQTLTRRKPKALAPGAMTHDWASFLGPTHNMFSTETKLLKEFPKDGLRPVWEMKKGEGCGAWCAAPRPATPPYAAPALTDY